MRATGRLALALVVAAIALVVPSAARDPAGTTGTTILYRSPAVAAAQGAANRAGLVIRYGDGRAETRCVDFAEAQISGYELLRRSGLPLAVAQGSEGTGICKINGDGCDPAQCLTCRGSAYWSYFHLVNGVWQYSVVGAAAYQVRPGALEGWTFGNGVRPPEASFAQVCSAPAIPTATLTPALPAPTPTAPPASAAPANRAGAVPPPIVLVGSTPTATPVPSAAPSGGPAASATAAAPPSPTATLPSSSEAAPASRPAAPAAIGAEPARPAAEAPATTAPAPPPAPTAPAAPATPTRTPLAAPTPAAAPPTPTLAPSPTVAAASPAASPSARPSAVATARPAPATATAVGSDAGRATATAPTAPPEVLTVLPAGATPTAARVAATATAPPSGALGATAAPGLGPGHILFGAASLALIGYLALASPRPK